VRCSVIVGVGYKIGVVICSVIVSLRHISWLFMLLLPILHAPASHTIVDKGAPVGVNANGTRDDVLGPAALVLAAAGVLVVAVLATVAVLLSKASISSSMLIGAALND
jgi:hypothetical protein